MDDLYRSELMEIYKDPSHHGNLNNPSVVLEKQNAFCGDKLHLSIKIKNNIIEDAKFEGSLCFVSIIGAEFLIEEIIGKTIEEAKKNSFNQEEYNSIDERIQFQKNKEEE
ncbi:MAG: SUF system FeS assembly protein, NifU family, partial [Candidatus Pacebacteria bacterium GW2011_GWF1_36_5]